MGGDTVPVFKGKNVHRGDVSLVPFWIGSNDHRIWILWACDGSGMNFFPLQTPHKFLSVTCGFFF